MVTWDRVAHADVVRAIKDYDRLGPERFFAEHGFAPTTTYEFAWEARLYPPKAILGAAYEFATGKRLASGDFEGGKSGAVKVLRARIHRPGEAPIAQVDGIVPPHRRPRPEPIPRRPAGATPCRAPGPGPRSDRRGPQGRPTT